MLHSSVPHYGTSLAADSGEGTTIMSNAIDRRDDGNPDAGDKNYGAVEFADPVNTKYPIDTPGHVRAAWSYSKQPDHAAKYDRDDVAPIKERITRAAKKHGVEIANEQD